MRLLGSCLLPRSGSGCCCSALAHCAAGAGKGGTQCNTYHAHALLQGITRKSIGLCAALYSTIALSGYVLFGEDTEGDVLKNLTIGFVGKLTSKQVAVWLINGIVVCNTFNLLVRVEGFRLWV